MLDTYYTDQYYYETALNWSRHDKALVPRVLLEANKRQPLTERQRLYHLIYAIPEACDAFGKLCVLCFDVSKEHSCCSPLVVHFFVEQPHVIMAEFGRFYHPICQECIRSLDAYIQKYRKEERYKNHVLAAAMHRLFGLKSFRQRIENNKHNQKLLRFDPRKREARAA